MSYHTNTPYDCDLLPEPRNNGNRWSDCHTHGISDGTVYTMIYEDSIGVKGEGKDVGVFGLSRHSGVGVIDTTLNGGIGGRFYGDGGIAIELEGSDSPWGNDFDDAVIRSEGDQPNGDLILVTNDFFSVHLDDDDNNNSEFAIINGDNEQILTLTEAGNLTITGTYDNGSDINRKEHFVAIESRSILDKVAKLPISEWQFKGEAIRHIGPMAQDFYTVFGLGKGDTTISTVDADGISFAAIQALKKENDSLKWENEIRAPLLTRSW